MTQIHRVAILAPLLAGGVAVICTIFIHGLLLSGTISFVRRETKLGRVGLSFWKDFGIAGLVISFASITHLIEIGLWAVLFVICGEFEGFGIAYYHSAMNYTTLGYGDVIMSPSWRLLGPLEAADGALMFGVSTAMVFALILRMIHARFIDLRE